MYILFIWKEKECKFITEEEKAFELFPSPKNNNISDIKSYFPKYLKLRKIPSIYFYLDETIENAEKMHKILDNLK